MKNIAANLIFVFGLFLLWFSVSLYFDKNESERGANQSYLFITDKADSLKEHDTKSINLLTQAYDDLHSLLSKAIILLFCTGLAMVIFTVTIYPRDHDKDSA